MMVYIDSCWKCAVSSGARESDSTWLLVCSSRREEGGTVLVHVDVPMLVV